MECHIIFKTVGGTCHLIPEKKLRGATMKTEAYCKKVKHNGRR